MVRTLIATLFALTLTQTGQNTKPLSAVLEESSKSSGLYAVAVPFLATALVTPSNQPITETNFEAYLLQIVGKLAIPSRLIKLYLPPPPKDHRWSSEELLAVASAHAKLFRKQVTDAKPGVIEIFAIETQPEQAKPAIDALQLKPVYVIALKHNYFGGVWQTTYGEMRLQQQGNRVIGTYSTGGGRIEGIVVGNDLRFRWLEERNGTSGAGTFQMAPDGMSFSGPWFNDTHQEAPAGTWTGQRLSKS